jgi:hypothetical protein
MGSETKIHTHSRSKSPTSMSKGIYGEHMETPFFFFGGGRAADFVRCRVTLL